MSSYMTDKTLVSAVKDIIAEQWLDSDDEAIVIKDLIERFESCNSEQERLFGVLNKHLRDEDGSDLLPDYARIANMIERLATKPPSNA